MTTFLPFLFFYVPCQICIHLLILSFDISAIRTHNNLYLGMKVFVSNSLIAHLPRLHLNFLLYMVLFAEI